MTEVLKYLSEKFEKEGIGCEFEGDIIASVSFSIGKAKAEDGTDLYFMVNRYNQIVYQFKDFNQAKTIFDMVLKGI